MKFTLAYFLECFYNICYHKCFKVKSIYKVYFDRTLRIQTIKDLITVIKKKRNNVFLLKNHSYYIVIFSIDDLKGYFISLGY